MNPIIRRELLEVLRTRKAIAVQLGLAIGCALLVLLRWPTEEQADLTGARSVQVLRMFGYGLMTGILLLVPAFPATSLVREKVKGTPDTDISIFPMAMPMIAGPGSIASVMLLMSQNDGLPRSLVIFGALALILVILLLALLLAGPIMRVLGSRIEAVISRVLGVLLGALATQFVIDGIRASLLVPH